MSAQTNGDSKYAGLRSGASYMAEGVQAVVSENESLTRAIDNLERERALMVERINQLTSKNRTLNSERDHYMRFSVELATQLGSLEGIIKNIKKTAEHAAFRDNDPSPAQQDEPSKAEQAGLAALAKRLSPAAQTN